MPEDRTNFKDVPFVSVRPEAVSLFDTILKNGSFLRIRVTGRSMTPFLIGGEVLIIKKVDVHTLRRGDLIFFRNSHGNAIVHRIIRWCGGEAGIQTKGDAGFALDEPVMESDVLGKVCLIEKDQGIVDMETLMQKGTNYIRAILQLLRYGMHRIAGPLNL